jgi:hypothetical protein
MIGVFGNHHFSQPQAETRLQQKSSPGKEQLHAALYAAARDLKSSTDPAQTAIHWQEVLLSVPVTFQIVAESDIFMTAYGLRQTCMQDSPQHWHQPGSFIAAGGAIKRQEAGDSSFSISDRSAPPAIH